MSAPEALNLVNGIRPFGPLILYQSAMGQGGNGDILYMFDEQVSARVVDF